MSKKTKDLLISSALTFVTGILIVVAPSIDTLTLESFHDGSLVGLLMVGVRLGLKMALEMFIASFKGETH